MSGFRLETRAHERAYPPNLRTDGSRMSRTDDPLMIDGENGAPEILGSGSKYEWGRSGESHAIWRSRKHTVVATYGGPRGRMNAWVEFQALETRARRERRRRRVRTVVVVGVLALAGAAVAAVLVTRNEVVATPGPVPGGTRTEVQRFQDPSGRYAFRYPAGWGLTQDPTSTQVYGPDDSVVVSIGDAPDGVPAAVAPGFAAESTAAWRDVQLEGVRARLVGNVEASSVGGAGTDATGTQVRLLAIVMPAGVDNIGITVIVPVDADLSIATPGVEQILATFRLLEG
jgi:hypothetical protein